MLKTSYSGGPGFPNIHIFVSDYEGWDHHSQRCEYCCRCWGLHGRLSFYSKGITNQSRGASYRIKNVVGEARVVYTNKVPRTAFRGYGVPEALFAMESLLDVAAEKLGIDPVEIRLRNCTHKGDITTHGWIINSCGLEDALKTVSKESNWSQKKQHKPDNTGIGVACQVNVSGQRALHAAYDGSGAMITMDQTGKIRVISGETEIGQGTTTVFAQIAAEELGVSIDDIEVVPFVDTDTMPYSIGTHASRVTTLGGNAVLLAAKDLRNKLYNMPPSS